MQIPIGALVSIFLGQLALSAVLPDPYANIQATSVELEPVSDIGIHQRSLETRNVGGVYLCQDSNWGGACIHQKPILFACYNLPDGFWDKLSSIGPDKGFKCTLYDNNFCNPNQGQLEDIRFPGISDLGQHGWNDRAASYGCFPG